MDIDGLRNMMFVFKTKSKRNIIQLFNFRSSKANNIDETQIKKVNDYLYIPIDLKNWLDIDTNKCLERVLTTLLHLTDPKSGRPGASIATIVAGYDENHQSNFIFTTDYIDGKHTVIGYYENGDEVIYRDSIVLRGKNCLDKYNDLSSKWQIK